MAAKRKPAPELKPRSDLRPVEHHCSKCGDLNALFGFGVSLRMGQAGTWYCQECRPE